MLEGIFLKKKKQKHSHVILVFFKVPFSLAVTTASASAQHAIEVVGIRGKNVIEHVDVNFLKFKWQVEFTNYNIFHCRSMKA